MIQYATVAIVVVVAAAYVVWRVIRASGTRRGCGSGTGCLSRQPPGDEPSRLGHRQQLVQLTVKKADKKDHAKTDG